MPCTFSLRALQPRLSSPGPEPPSSSSSRRSPLGLSASRRPWPPLSATPLRRSDRPDTRSVAASAARCTSSASSCCPASRSASVGPLLLSVLLVVSAIAAPPGGYAGWLRFRPAALGFRPAAVVFRPEVSPPASFWVRRALGAARFNVAVGAPRAAGCLTGASGVLPASPWRFFSIAAASRAGRLVAVLVRWVFVVLVDLRLIDLRLIDLRLITGPLLGPRGCPC